MLRPVNSNHGLLKKVQSLSTPAIQMRTGAASATIRKRDSLSRNSVCSSYALLDHCRQKQQRNRQND